MKPADNLEEIILLANELHAGQLDKSGRPYVGHCERVAALVRRSGGDWTQEWAAWLHDSMEDTYASMEYLLGRGVPRIVVDIVVVLTHAKNEPNIDYWNTILEVPGAKLVKICDIYDNLDPSRMCYLDEQTQARLRKKYAKALEVLA